MIQYARLRPGPGFMPGRAAAYYAQRLAIHPLLRRGVAEVLGMAVRLRHRANRRAAGHAPGAVAGDDAGILATLGREGLAMLPPLLPAPALARMVDYFRRCPVLGPGGQAMAVDALPPDCAVAPYPLETVLSCPGLVEAINDPAVLGHARRYLRCPPTISSLGVRWSLPAARMRHETQSFHRDTDDWRFVKLFVYLTDVDARSGPHVFVAGSHRTRATLRARRYDAAEVERHYGAAGLRTATGPAGTTFMADTFGIHRGVPPLDRPRLILQVQYSVLPVFAFSYAPVRAAPPPGLDRYVNRLLLA